MLLDVVVCFVVLLLKYINGIMVAIIIIIIRMSIAIVIKIIIFRLLEEKRAIVSKIYLKKNIMG